MSKHSDTKTGRTIAALGGGALLLWLLLRGKGWGLGDDRSASTAAPRGPATPPRCRVRIDHSGIELDGVRADVSAVVERCRETGAADVLATGAAISGVVQEVLDALRRAGVKVQLDAPTSATTTGSEAA